jgi:hypothetical protein
VLTLDESQRPPWVKKNYEKVGYKLILQRNCGVP